MKIIYDKPKMIQNNHSVKWNMMLTEKPDADLIPFTVADMEFMTPQVITDALTNHLHTNLLGYSFVDNAYKEAVVQWFKVRHNTHYDPQHLVLTQGVVNALYNLVPVLTQPTDHVLVFTPVYGPFFSAIEASGRTVLTTSLIDTAGVYTIDYDDLDQKLSAPSCSLLILCNPHNPVGRVWTYDELSEINKLAQKHNVNVISDEIHCDLLVDGHLFNSYHAVDHQAIICTAASKTFNLATMQTSNIFIPDTKIRKAFEERLRDGGHHGPGALGMLATQTAYNEGSTWLDGCLDVIADNYHFLKEALSATKLVVSPLEGTYLVWISYKNYDITEKELMKKFKAENLFFNSGTYFGVDGDGYFRMNIACDKKYIIEACQRIIRVINYL